MSFQQPSLPDPNQPTQQFPPPPQGQPPVGHGARRRPWIRRHPILTGIGGFVLLIVILAVILPAPKPAASDHHATTAPIQPAATTAPAVVTTATLLESWWNAGGKGAMVALETAMGDISTATTTAAQSGSVTGVETACTNLSTAITNVEALGPAPYKPVAKWMSRALAHYQTGASECIAGSQAMNASMIEDAGTQFRYGTTDLTKATAAIASLEDGS
jgi:hypothetical protein